ncbi:H2B [Hepatospora eriocheir]|uniref:H2B n=1 Tax=Hepatospora eriocheir TaxID=1081669 RepID=A0A1X0Q8N7_9MICR|nr:H2B [Hepatospora eriocheir]
MASPLKSTGKAPVKAVGTPSQPGEKKKRRKTDGLNSSIFRAPTKRMIRDSVGESHVTCTKQGLTVFCELAHKMLYMIGENLRELGHKGKKKTVGRREIETAVMLVFDGEMSRIMLREMRSTISKSQAKSANK